MCNLEKKSKKRQVTGYKIAVKRNGKYYSPATGVEYRPGPVSQVPKIFSYKDSKNESRNIWFSPRMDYIEEARSISKHVSKGEKIDREDVIKITDLLPKSDHFYFINMEGRTAVFKTKKGIEYYTTLTSGGETCLLMMTIKEDIMEGTINDSSDIPIFAGKEIIKFEEISKEN